jgi:hypothetical protein
MTPDINADTGLGAAGWAYGSQMWIGQNPALAPNPTTASKKQVLGTCNLVPYVEAHISKSKLPVTRDRDANSSKRNTVPSCEATKYTCPARLTSAFSCSDVTKKYEAIDIASQAIMNSTASLANSSSTIDATSKL